MYEKFTAPDDGVWMITLSQSESDLVGVTGPSAVDCDKACKDSDTSKPVKMLRGG
jgi:hypothetical protein